MDHRELMLTGTALEIIGTFFLAVEAIKLSNLRFLREKVLKVAALKVNPIVYLVDKETPESRTGEMWLRCLMALFIGLGLSISYTFLRFNGHSLNDVWQLFASTVPGPSWVDLLLAIPTAFILAVVFSVVGSGAYTIPVIVLDGAIRVLLFIETHTASGVIGVLGFLTFLAGAAIKGYVYWVGV